MSRSIHDENIPPIRIAAPLRRELEAAAVQEGHTLSSLCRRILIDFAERRVLSREAKAAA